MTQLDTQSRSNRGRSSQLQSNCDEQHRKRHQGYSCTEATSLMERDSGLAGAPLGGGGRGAGAARAGAIACEPVSWRPGSARRPATGDTVPSATGRDAVTLSGVDGGRGLRCTARQGWPLSRSEIAQIAQQARQGGCSGARAVLARASTSPSPVLPRRDTQYRSVRRWTERIIGRPVGVGAVVRALRAAGLAPWSDPAR